MIDSFVFYKSFYSSICLLSTDTEKWEAIKNMCELAFNGKEADLSDSTDMVKVIYTVTETQIKASLQHKIDGAKGGYAKGKSYKNKNRGVNSPLNTNVNVNVNDNVNVNVNDNDIAEMALDITPVQENYSKQVFDMWQEADMPGSKDLFKFTSREFKNALTAIKGYHSDEVIGACKNYLSVLKDSSTWVTKSLTFDKFVNSKLFTDCLPDNFVSDNFKADNWMKDSKTLKMPETPKKFFSQEPCRKCGKKKLWFDNDKQKYICDSCGASFEFEDIQGAYLNG